MFLGVPIVVIGIRCYLGIGGDWGRRFDCPPGLLKPVHCVDQAMPFTFVIDHPPFLPGWVTITGAR